MARLGVLEGAAMLAERNFPKWVNDRSQAVPTPETLRVVRNGLLREIRQTYTPADSSAGRVVLTGNLREFQAVQTDLMFPYTWGTYYVQRYLQARQGDWQRRYHELFDPERAPRTTREIIRGEVATSPQSSPQVDLGKVIERWIEANPKWRPVGRPSRVGALLTRLWTGEGVTPAAAAAALGAHDDWYAIIEIPGELEPNEVAGLATLTFGSEAEAELFIAHLPPTEDGNPGKDGGQDGVAVAMVRIGRLVVAPLGRCPTPLFAAAVEQAGGVQLPPPPATTDGAIAELGLFRDEETPGRHERVVNALAMVVNSGDTRSIASVGRALFEPDRDLRKADEENLDREIELGRRLADGFARRLSHDGVGALAIAAVVSLEGRNSPPVNRLTATRYLIAVREQLDPELRRRAGAAVARSFAHRPDVASTASVLLDPNIRHETRAGSTPEVTR
jgi:hypothetical protein